MNNCPAHAGVEARIVIYKWLLGILILCMLGIFSFQGVILLQGYELKTAQAVLGNKIDNLQKQVNGNYYFRPNPERQGG